MKSILVLILLIPVLSFNVNAESIFTLSSPSFDDGAKLPLKQVANFNDCKGNNDSPALEWTDGPRGTLSYAVTVYDPDAPSGSGWWHWILFNIPSDVTSLKEEMHVFPPGSIQARNDYGDSKYGGACPPKGSKPHRYLITVFALKVKKIPLNKDASGAMVGFYIQKNALAKASITATYSR